jgi:hypothetical protein
MLTQPVPGEDRDAGLYINARSERMPLGTQVLDQTVGEERTCWVAAEDFMSMQKGCDELRRTLALINATHRLGGRGREERVSALLDGAGFGVEEARAIASIVAQVRSEGEPQARAA